MCGVRKDVGLDDIAPDTQGSARDGQVRQREEECDIISENMRPGNVSSQPAAVCGLGDGRGRHTVVQRRERMRMSCQTLVEAIAEKYFLDLDVTQGT